MQFELDGNFICFMPGTTEIPDRPETEEENNELPDTPSPTPTEIPVIEIEDENTPLASRLYTDGTMPESVESENYTQDIYTESIYADVTPLAYYHTEEQISKETVITIVGLTLLLAVCIVWVGSYMTRRARERERWKWH